MEAWQRDSWRACGGEEQHRKAESSGSAERLGRSTGRQRGGQQRWLGTGEVEGAGTQQGEGIQGPGLPLNHVFSDERTGMNLIWLGEMLHIWRPVLYVWLLYRCMCFLIGTFFSACSGSDYSCGL